MNQNPPPSGNLRPYHSAFDPRLDPYLMGMRSAGVPTARQMQALPPGATDAECIAWLEGFIVGAKRLAAAAR